MACPVCGSHSPCAHAQQHAAVLIGPEVSNPTQQKAAEPVAASQPAVLSAVAGEIMDRSNTNIWREEVISRVQQHRARRRRRVDSDASLEFDFQAGGELSASPAIDTEVTRPRTHTRPEQPKIIEFPRPQSYFARIEAQRCEDDELAEPVIESPRILEAQEPPAEQMNLLPAFADIQLEAEERKASHDLELPLQAAPLAQRTFAGLVDMIVVLIASALFAIAFVMFAKALPQLRLTLLCGLLIGGTLWLIYQYLFLVYLSATPGMQLAQLELCTFRGSPVPVSLRRCRALASMLSVLALGLGFAWAFVDEDTLGWHDRMTQTHLRQRTAISEPSAG